MTSCGVKKEKKNSKMGMDYESILKKYAKYTSFAKTKRDKPKTHYKSF